MDDRQQIGLTPAALKQLQEILDAGWFDEGQEVARVALAYAMKHGVEPGVSASVQTRWNTSLFDSTGDFSALVTVLYPEAPLVRTLEHFVNEGLGLIHRQLVTEGKTPANLLG